MTVRPMTAAVDRHLLRRRWILAFLLGELVGFVPPAVAGAVLASRGASDAALVAGLTIAGLFEGLAIGSVQAWVLARHAPAISRRAWILGTTLAAGFAWLAGMGGSALMSAQGASPWLLVILIPVWTAGLASMGAAQWLAMKAVVPNSVRWIWVNSAAWLIGVMIPVLALSAAPNAWPAWAHALVGVIAAVAMGLTVGAITAGTLERLLTGARRRDPPS